MLSIMLQHKTPAKNASRLFLFDWETLPVFKRMYPMSRLAIPHKTFTIGDDNLLPGGFANGDGKLSPDTPCMKCGTKLVRKKPEKKQAT